MGGRREVCDSRNRSKSWWRVEKARLYLNIHCAAPRNHIVAECNIPNRRSSDYFSTKVKCVTEQHHNEVLRRCRDALTHKSSSPDGRKHVCFVLLLHLMCSLDHLFLLVIITLNSSKLIWRCRFLSLFSLFDTEYKKHFSTTKFQFANSSQIVLVK